MRFLTVMAAGLVLLMGSSAYAGKLFDLARVEKRYGKEVVQALRRLQAPETKTSLVNPRPVHSSWTDTPASRAYRAWLKGALGPNLDVLENKLRLEIQITRQQPEIQMMREYFQAAFSGRGRK